MENMEFTYIKDVSEDKISDYPLVVCAINAILRVKDVARIIGIKNNNAASEQFGKEKLSKGIKVDRDSEGIIFHINAVIRYGAKIPVVAWNIQEAVKKEVEEITDKKVKAVNVTIVKVEF